MEALRGEQRPWLVHASAALTVDLLVMLTRFMLRGGGEGSFHISSTVQQVGEAYGVTAEAQAFPDSAVLLVRTDEGEWSAVIHEVADIPRLGRAAELRELLHEIDGGRLPVGQALQRLERLGSSSALYPAWTVLPGLAPFALGFAPSVQATWQEVILSPLLGALVGAFVLLRRAEPKLAPAAPLPALGTGDLVQGFTSWFDMAEVGTALALGMLLGNVLASLVPDRRHQPGRQ